jgi:Flp pilus assembly protein TadG
MNRAVEITVQRRACAPRAGNAENGSGQAIVELTLLLPLLVLIFLAAADLARMFYHATALAQAARSGAQYGAQNLGTSADVAGMTQAAMSSAADDLGTITVAPAPKRYFQCGSEATTSNELPCADKRAAKVFVEVSVAKTFSTLFDYPGIPHTVPMSRVAIMRVQ